MFGSNDLVSYFVALSPCKALLHIELIVIGYNIKHISIVCRLKDTNSFKLFLIVTLSIKEEEAFHNYKQSFAAKIMDI
jgi:hypothetical protein